MGLAETIAELNRKMNGNNTEPASLIVPTETDAPGWEKLYDEGYIIEVMRIDSKPHVGRSRWYTATRTTFRSSLKRKFRLKENNDTETDVPF